MTGVSADGRFDDARYGATDEEVCDYIASMCVALQRRIPEARFSHLVRFLDMARMEADILKQGHQRASSRAGENSR